MTCSSGHEALAVGQHDEAGQQRRDLHPGEAALAGGRVAHGDGQVERQVGDVGERVARGRRPAGVSTGKTPPLEHLVEVREVVLAELAESC